MAAGTKYTEAELLEKEGPKAITARISRQVFDKSWFLNRCFVTFPPRMAQKVDAKDMIPPDTLIDSVENADMEHRDYEVEGHEVFSQKPYYFKEKYNVKNTDFDSLPFNMAFGSDFSPSQKALYMYRFAATRMAVSAKTTQEKMAIDAIVNNKVAWKTWKKNGTSSDVELLTNMSSDNREDVASTDHWSVNGKKPADNLKRWAQVCRENGGGEPKYVIMGSDVASAFENNASVLDKLSMPKYKGIQLESSFLPRAHVRFIGTMDGLEFYAYNNFYKVKPNNQGDPYTVHPMLPADRLIMAPAISDIPGGLFYCRVDRDDVNGPIDVMFGKVPNKLMGTNTIFMESNFVVGVLKPDAFFCAKFLT